MVDIINSFGKNAGKVWRTLDSNGPLPEDKVTKKTSLKKDDFYSAVGWLARENKICIDGGTYKLGKTNLASKIGKDAGMVWKVLDIWEDAGIKSISRLTHIDEKEIYSALGWLAREDKIDARLNKQKNLIKYQLK